MFDIDLMHSTVTLFFIKVPISDLFMYLGALIGFYKNYRTNLNIYEKQFESLELTKEEKVEAIKIARYKFIRDNSKTHYMKIRELIENSENKIDDKALLYIKSFCSALNDAFGSEPTESEIALMKLKGNEIHQEVKLLQGSKITK